MQHKKSEISFTPGSPNRLRIVAQTAFVVGATAFSLAGFDRPAQAGGKSTVNITRFEKENNEATRANTTKGHWEINSERYFPIGIWSPDRTVLQAALDMGITLFASPSDPDYQAFSQTVGDRGYLLAPYDLNVNTDNQVGSMGDEPDADKNRMPPNVFSKKNDGQLVVINFTQHFAQGEDPIPGITIEDYKAYIAQADSVGVDIYPWNRKSNFVSIGSTYDFQKDLVKLAEGKPTFQFIELNVIDSLANQQQIPPEAISAEVGLALAGGAKGIYWWTHTFDNQHWNKFNIPEEVKPVVTAVNHALRNDTKLFTSPEVPISKIPRDVINGISKYPVKAGVRSVEDEAGGKKYYAIIANSSAQEQPVSLSLPGLNGQRVSVYKKFDAKSLLNSDQQLPEVVFLAVGDVLTGKLHGYQWVIVEYTPAPVASNKVTSGNKIRSTKKSLKPKSIRINNQIKLLRAKR